jgi:hypothetical protein
MNRRKITTALIIAVMISLVNLGSQTAAFAGEAFWTANNQSVFDVPDDAEINQQLAQVRRTTAKYHDINVAIADGFAVFGNGDCVEYADGVSGISYANLDRVRQQGVIAEEPELLFYVPSGDDNLRLVAVAYFNRALYTDTRGIIPGTFPSRLNPPPSFFQEVSGSFDLFNRTADGPMIETGTPWFTLSAPGFGRRIQTECSLNTIRV